MATGNLGFGDLSVRIPGGFQTQPAIGPSSIYLFVNCLNIKCLPHARHQGYNDKRATLWWLS